MKKGFTLIELLAVIIILAIVALIATPIVLNVVEDAKKSAGQSEANMVLKGITDYCEQEKMGIAKTDYCTDTKKLSDNLDKIVNLGKLDKKDVEVSVKDGKLDWLKVTSNGKNFGLQDGKLVEGITERQPNLIKTLLNQYNPENTVGLIKDGNTDRYYYKGTNEDVSNNFLWYGGHQWRVLEFDTNKKTLKLITQQPLTVIQVAQVIWTNAASYESTYINKWLNTYFYDSLEKSIQENIVNTIFNIGSSPNISDLTVSKKVGLLDEIQYINAGGANSFLNINDSWWLSNKSNNSRIGTVDYYSHGGIYNTTVSDEYGVRAVISISDITIHEGEGTLAQNYKVSEKLNNNGLVQVGDYIKVPYEGNDNTCGNDKMCLFRVVSIDHDSIKVTLNGLLPIESKYGNDAKITLNHDIYTYLKKFANGINDKYQYSKIKKFNIGIYDLGKDYESVSGEIIEVNVGLPVIGEMFSGNDIDIDKFTKTFVDINLIENPFVSYDYWIMNRFDVNQVNHITSYGYMRKNTPFNSSYGVRPVIFLKNDLKLVSGDGSPSAPYELE